MRPSRLLASVLAFTSIATTVALAAPPQFPNAVSAGDVSSSSAVLWARAAAGGAVTFEWSKDPTFATIDGSTIVVSPTPLVPAKAYVAGLLSGTTYAFRATDASGIAVSGSFRTSRDRGVSGGLRFGVTGDWRGELAPYPAISNAKDRDLEFMVKFGDTIYADYASPDVPTPQCLSLDEFRAKHNEVYSERYGLNAWADLQSVVPIFSMIDDHEVTNDFAGGASPDGEPLFATAIATVESPAALDSPRGNFADSDDPAVWVHPTDASLSIIVATKKDGGLSVFDLSGTVLQEVLPGDVRYNNVDIVSGFSLGGVSTDLAVVSDRQNDLLVVFAIDPLTRTLSDVTDPMMGRIFPSSPIGEQKTAYGLAAYRDGASGTQYVFVSRRKKSTVAQLELVDNAGTVGWTLARTIALPSSFEGWSPDNPQVEGITTDAEFGVVYLAQEQVGIWRTDASPSSATAPVLIDRVKSFGGAAGPGTSITADVEGLAIHPTAGGQGWLIASSQGDNTFVAYGRTDNVLVGRFTIAGADGIDSVQHCDGAEIVASPLGSAFPNGLLVVQDGDNLPAVLVDDEGEIVNINTNFKLVPWESVEQAVTSMPAYVNQTQIYANGLQAFGEYNAIAESTWSRTGDPRFDGRPNLYRYRTFGNDAAMFLLDARSFRDKELPGVTNPADPLQIGAFLVASFDPSRTMLGGPQKAALKSDLLDAQQSGITWKFILVPEPIQNLGVLAASDRFEGYAAERSEILAFVAAQGIENVVFVAADIHGTLVNDITYQTAPFAPQIPTGSFEITTGSVAFDAPFGPTVVALGAAVGLLSPQQVAFYQSLPTPGKDAFVRSVVNQTIAPLGYDALGLENGPLNATLLEGSYVPTHTYGWTEFDIDQGTKALTVTTFGIDPYTAAELLADPQPIVDRRPTVVSRFQVQPAGSTACPGDLDGDGAVGPLDLATLLGGWGSAEGDVDGDGVVNAIDLAFVLQGWGACP